MQDFDATGQILGLELFATGLRAVLISRDGVIMSRHAAGLDVDNIPASVATLVSQLRHEHPIAAMGVAVPGLVNHAANQVAMSTELPGTTRAGFYQELCAALDSPVWLENDANAAAYGEYFFGAGRGCRDLFYATIGSGVGGALILGGQLWRGTSGFAGEFGYMTISVENDITLEMMASATNIESRTRNRLRQDATSSLSPLGVMPSFTVFDIIHAAREDGDDFALMMLERTGRFIGTSIASVINLLNVERIAIGGTVADAAREMLLDPIRHEAERLAFGPYFATTSIVPAQLGNDAVALGVALLARETANSAANVV